MIHIHAFLIELGFVESGFDRHVRGQRRKHIFDSTETIAILCTTDFIVCVHSHISCYESWVVPAGAASALADILGAEFRPKIDFVKERGGV